MTTYKYSGEDIAAAFNRLAPSTRCDTCGHPRYRHRREIVKPGIFDGIEAHHECQKRDLRRKSGKCPCEQFAEPAANQQNRSDENA